MLPALPPLNFSGRVLRAI